MLGVDDFAFRRGNTYGTVLVDVETSSIIDLLNERTTEVLDAWLDAHPGAEIEHVIDALRHERYRWSPARRVYIRAGRNHPGRSIRCARWTCGPRDSG